VSETWSRTSNEEYRLRVFEHRVLRKIFGSKREKTTEGRTQIKSGELQCNEELHDLYSSPDARVIKPRKK
jgi:hypothetical protein